MKRFLLAWLVLLGVVGGGERTAQAQPISDRTPMCANSTPEPCDCSLCPCDGNYSLVTTVNMAWVGDGIDYATAGGNKGCASCGGGVPKVGELPGLEVHRYHRYRDIGFPSSLGPGSFTNFDVTLSLYQTGADVSSGGGSVRFLDPRSSAYRNLRNNGQGTYLDIFTGAIRSLTLLDASSNIALDQATAVGALLLTHKGEQYTFEIIRTDANPVTPARYGRLTKQTDRNGNAITLTYQFPRDATDAALGFDRRNLWKLASVTDAYGRQATFTYVRVRTWGPWAVSRIDLPSGQHLTYGYDNPSLLGLSEVVHPDGTTTVLSTTADGATQTTVLHYFDAAAEGTHRRKSVNLTNPSWVDPVTHQVFSQTANLARQIVNGAGEVSYQITGAVNMAAQRNTYYVHDGGLSFHRLTTDLWGGSLARDQALGGSLAQDPATFAYQKVATYQITTFRRLLGVTDLLGRKMAYEPDLATGAVKKKTFPDGSSSTSTYNQFVEPLLEVDRLGQKTQYVYNANGNKLSKTVAAGKPEQATWSWTYNARGQTTTATDANGNVTAYAYTPEGHLASMTEPPDSPGGPQAVTSYTYDGAGRLTSMTDPLGRLTSYAHDVRNRVTAITYNDGTAEHYVFGTGPNANLLMQKIDRLGNVEAHSYDGQGRETLRIQAFGKPEAVSRSCTYLAGTNLEKECTDRGERTVYTYDSYNRLVATTVQPNTSTQLTDAIAYDEDRRVDHAVDRYGRKTFNVYDVNRRIVRLVRETVPGAVTPPGGQAQRDAFLMGLPRALGPNAAYLIEDTTYDAHGQVLAKIDGRGIQETLAYDGQGRKIRQTEAAGRPEAAKTEYEYDPQGNVILTRHPRHFTEPGGFMTQYTYTSRNLLASATSALGQPEQTTETYGYDLDRRRSLRIDARGNAWNTVWDGCCGYHEAEIDPVADVDGDPSTPAARAIHIGNRDSLNHVTHEYVAPDVAALPTDADMHAPSVTLKTATTRYDGRYRPIARTVWMVELGAVNQNNPPIAGDPGYPAANGLTTRWAYDDDLTNGVGLDAMYGGSFAGLGFGPGSDGSAVEMTNPAGETAVTIYDGLGRVLETIDGNGNTMLQTYDAVVAGTPGAPGTLVETTSFDGLNHTRRSRTDGAWRILSTVDPDGQPTTYGVDAGSNRITSRDPNGVGHDCVFDGRNRATQCTDTHGDVTKKAYDTHGNVVTTTDALNQVTTCAFDARDRKKFCTNRVNAVTVFSYDGSNNILAITDAEGGVTAYTYDTRNLLADEHFPGHSLPSNNERRSYTYDAARRTTSRLDQNLDRTMYAYDRADRLTNRAYPDSLNDTFGYDPANRLTAADSARYAVQVDRTYDAAGRLLSEMHTIGGTAYVVSHAHDASNRTVQITYPGGSVVSRSYTDRDQLASVTLDGQPVAMREYDVGHRLTTTTLGNGLVETRTYVPGDGLVQTIEVPGVTSFGYTYDADKRKVAETDGILAANGQGFGYDAESRLTTWARTDGVAATDTQAWNLTPVGDWASTTRDGVTEPRAHNSVHEVTMVGALPLSYDSKGNLTVDELGQSYTWDVENRLASAIVPATATEAGKVASYRYDALDRRVEKTVNGNATRFIHDGNQVVVELDLPGAGQRTYVHGSYVDEPLLFVNNGAKYYYHANYFHSVAAMTDGAGAVVERQRYDAYGRHTMLDATGATIPASTIGQQRAFTGQYVDAETGLLFMRGRYFRYDGFLSRDPKGYVDGMSMYGSYFVPNGVDPSGTSYESFMDCVSMIECCPTDEDCFNDALEACYQQSLQDDAPPDGSGGGGAPPPVGAGDGNGNGTPPLGEGNGNGTPPPGGGGDVIPVAPPIEQGGVQPPADSVIQALGLSGFLAGGGFAGSSGISFAWQRDSEGNLLGSFVFTGGLGGGMGASGGVSYSRSSGTLAEGWSTAVNAQVAGLGPGGRLGTGLSIAPGPTVTGWSIGAGPGGGAAATTERSYTTPPVNLIQSAVGPSEAGLGGWGWGF